MLRVKRRCRRRRNPGDNAVTIPAPDARTDVQKYIDEIAPANIVGRMVKFSKDGDAFHAAGGGNLFVGRS